MIAVLFDLVYLLLLCLLSPALSVLALKDPSPQQGRSHKFLGRVPNRASTDPCVWLHAVSVGEVNLLPGLVKELSERRSHVQVVISVTTSTGFDVAQRHFPEHSVFFCPLDFS